MSQPSVRLTRKDLADLRRLVEHHGSRAAASASLCLNKNAAGRILKVGRCDPSTLRRIRLSADRLREPSRGRATGANLEALSRAHCELEEAKADRLALEAEVARLQALVKEARDTAEANQDALRVLGRQYTELLDRYDQARERAARVIACQAEALHLLTRAAGS